MHLADRVAVLIDYQKNVLGQVPGIRERILEYSVKTFDPIVVNCFLRLSEHEYSAHSSGTAVCAEALGETRRFFKKESQMLKVAGFLHDPGKIVVPESF